MPNYTILDCESTGLVAPMRAVEIAWVVIDADMNVLHEEVALTDPERDIDKGAEAIHGISYDMVKGKPCNAEVVARIPTPTVVIGHNCSYDIRVLGENMTIAETLCTLALARRWVKGTTNHKLETLQRELGLSQQKSHSALGDCRTTLELLKLIRGLSGRTLPELVTLEQVPKMLNTMPFGKHRGLLMTKVPKPYRDWMLAQSEIPRDLRYTLERLAVV